MINRTRDAPAREVRDDPLECSPIDLHFASVSSIVAPQRMDVNCYAPFCIILFRSNHLTSVTVGVQ